MSISRWSPGELSLPNDAPLQHCALLFGMPVSREAFDYACARTPRSDYLTHVVGEDPEETWNRGYAEIVSAAQELISIASNAGATIYPEATLADFAAATARARVVILLAHFRGFDFSEADFLVPYEDIVVKIHSHQDAVLRYFDPAPHEVGLLVDAFNAAVMDRRLLPYLPEHLGDAGRRSITLGRVICRDLLDEALAGLIRPGNRVEFFDGLYTPGDFEVALNGGFRGELDLALCNSAALATVIDLRRQNTVHHLHWPDLVHPVPQFVLIGKALLSIARNGGSYIQARLELEREILRIDWR